MDSLPRPPPIDHRTVTLSQRRCRDLTRVEDLNHPSRFPVSNSPCSPSPSPLASRSVSDPDPVTDKLKSCLKGFVCPLNEVRPGTVCRVRQVLASPEMSRRIREMGFCEDQQIRCLSQQCMMICQVCNARLGLSEELAKAILVEPEPVLREAS